MPTTTKMGIAYPASTDLVKDGATNMGTIATTVDNKTGLVLLNTTTFTGVSTQSINSVFTSTFDNYYIEIDFTVPTSGGDTGFRLRKSGTDKITNYVTKGTFLNPLVADYGSGTTTLLYVANASVNSLDLVTINVSRPAISGPTVIMSNSVALSSVRYLTSGRQTDTDTFDGFTFYNVGSNNMAGTIKVFGVNE
jgi:hypothetical protein